MAVESGPSRKAINSLGKTACILDKFLINKWEKLGGVDLMLSNIDF